MADRVYKTLTGGLRREDEKHPATHIILTVEEYEELRKELKAAIYMKDETERDAKEYKKKVDEEARTIVRQAEKKVDEITKSLDTEKQNRVYQEKLNKNLLRINKERSNAERKLQPKKEHTGYVLLQSQEKEIRNINPNERNPQLVWETSLQTPYTVELSADEAKTQIVNDMGNYQTLALLSELGIERVLNNMSNRTPEEFRINRNISDERQLKDGENTVIKTFLRQNFKNGYWEVIYQHTHNITYVPRNMRSK